MRHSTAWPRMITSCWRIDSFSPAGDAQLLAHEIDAGDQLGDRVLDLIRACSSR
jgi:hypothetical protein